MASAEKTRFHKPTEMFMDVFDKPSALIEKQMREFKEYVQNHKEHYPLDNYDKM
jgi:hypothetical protein